MSLERTTDSISLSTPRSSSSLEREIFICSVGLPGWQITTSDVQLVALVHTHTYVMNTRPRSIFLDSSASACHTHTRRALSLSTSIAAQRVCPPRQCRWCNLVSGVTEVGLWEVTRFKGEALRRGLVPL